VPLIVDASVAVAWFVRNQADPYSDRIRRRVRRERLHVPAVWPLEFANALWQLQRRKLLTSGQVDTIIELAEPLEIIVHGEVLAPRRRPPRLPRDA
jgi:predicted nucleic acid-binding protein